MSDAKFTKGEWKIVIGDEVSDSTLRVFSGVVCVSYHGHYCQEAISNAHLIAAAPEMYEMIEQLSSELLHAIGEVNDMRKAKVYGSDLTQPDLWDAESCYLADKLLAKARGEQK